MCFGRRACTPQRDVDVPVRPLGADAGLLRRGERILAKCDYDVLVGRRTKGLDANQVKLDDAGTNQVH